LREKVIVESLDKHWFRTHYNLIPFYSLSFQMAISLQTSKHNKQIVYKIIFRCKYPKCTIHIHICMRKEWTNMLQNLCYNCDPFLLHKSIYFMEHKYDITQCDDLLSQQNSIWQTSLQHLRVSITILNTVSKKVCLVYISLSSTDKHTDLPGTQMETSIIIELLFQTEH